MKYINRKTVLSSLLLVAVAISSCKKDFLDVNDDPNRVTDSNVTPELIFANAATAVGARVAAGNFLQNWVGYLSSSGDFAIQQQETSYNIDFTFGDGYWQAHYGVLFDLNLTRQKALEKGDVVLAGASMILSVKLWQELVDLFGDIPYSEAFQNSVTRTPKYDDDAAIYADLQKKLDTAKDYMGEAAKANFSSVDIVNKGNQGKWIKFANTLKLRLLIRQSQVSGFDPTAELAKIDDVGVLGSGETVSVNPGYVNDVNKQSPFYAAYGYTSAAEPADANTSVRANQYIVNLMQSTSDPRVNKIFAPLAGGSVVGTTYGLAAGNPVGAASSKFGSGLLGDNAGAGGATGPSQNQWIMTSVESMFLDAEAKARGWNTGNPATTEALYDSAVSESFKFLRVGPTADSSASAASKYRDGNPIADWVNAGGAGLPQAKFIVYQKYLALTGIDALEAYSDIRRLNMITDKGYISVNPGRLSNSVPNRLLYPQSEYTTNGDNVNAQGSINQFTSKIFWQP